MATYQTSREQASWGRYDSGLSKGGTAEVGGVDMLPSCADRENSAYADQWVI